MATTDIWAFRPELRGADLRGFTVTAADGPIGYVEEAATEPGASWIVLNTGPWIYGRKVMLPAGVVDRVDVKAEALSVDRTQDEIREAPPLAVSYRDEPYRGELGAFYRRD
jgi:hypothetical protein